MTRRSPLEIRASILQVVSDLEQTSDGARPTKIMVKAHTSWMYLEEYADQLVERGFLVKTQRSWSGPEKRYVYRVTDAGWDVLRRYDVLKRDLVG